MLRVVFAVAVVFALLNLGVPERSLWAQAEPDKAAAGSPAAGQTAEGTVSEQETPTVEQARVRFEEQYSKWQEAIKELRRIQNQYNGSTPDEAPAFQKKWDDQIAATEKMIPALRTAATDYYLAAPNSRRDITLFLAKLLEDDVARDQFQQAAELAQILIDHDCDNPRVYRDAGIAFFANHQFEKSEACLKKASENGALMPPPPDQEDKQTARLVQLAAGLLGDVAEYQQLWEKEQEILEKEAASDDLPRVKLTTSKGDVVLELFENEAPDTVGNFIKLVEDGFYDGLTFHRVLPGFMAQGGCPNGDGSGGPGYEIYDEFDKEDRRNHFRGYLSMAKKPASNSGGSQFFITFLPTPHLNGHHTAFGRVIEGMDVVNSLQRRDPAHLPPPDRDAGGS